jgi:hypothetical protein
MAQWPGDRLHDKCRGDAQQAAPKVFWKVYRWF